MNFQNILLITLTVIVQCGISTAKPETWTLNNKQTVEGELHTIRKGNVAIKTPNKQIVSIGFKAFSPSSQGKIKLWAHNQGGNLEFASWIKSPDSAFNQPWPKSVYGPNTPTVYINQKETKKGHYVYDSDHYKFISDGRLDRRVVQKFTTLFETTYNYNMKLPINVPGKYRPKDHKFTIYLFGRYENYLRNGGSPGSAGVYLINHQVILVPMASLGLFWDISKWKYDKSKQNSVLSHEITHQLMAGINKAPWFIEGSAEYVANTRYTHATFHVHGAKYNIFKSVVYKNPGNLQTARKLGPKVIMPPLKSFMNMNYDQFSGSNTNRNYGMALLLTYYFYHIDGSGNAHSIKNYVKAIQRGKSEPEAQKALLNGRSYETLQKSFAKFCSANGLVLEFTK